MDRLPYIELENVAINIKAWEINGKYVQKN